MIIGKYYTKRIIKNTSNENVLFVWGIMKSCKIIIKDEVNIKLEGLDLDVRKKLVNTFKYMLPYARHMPAYKLGRWDRNSKFFPNGR